MHHDQHVPGSEKQPSIVQSGPNKRRRARTRTYLTVGVAVTAALIGGLTSCADSNAPADKAGPPSAEGRTGNTGPREHIGRYTLSMPDNLLNGAYEKSARSEMGGGEPNPAFGILNGTTAYAEYSSRDGSTELSVMGAHGTLKEPRKSLQRWLSDFKSNLGASEPVWLEPAGFDGDVKCLYFSRDRIPACGWADRHTIGVVMQMSAQGTPELSDFADTMMEIREEVRVEK